MTAQPNILLITADQFRWDCLGCAGNETIQTPHLDALAARGVRFRNGFTPNPICVPARASIMASPKARANSLRPSALPAQGTTPEAGKK